MLQTLSWEKRLHFNQARIIVAVAEHGSFGKAARQLFCSQSVVSRSVAAAEETVGCELFERTWNNARPTAVGESIVSKCRSALDRVHALEKSFSTVGSRPNLTSFLKWHHLEAISAIVRYGSATIAADHLGWSQPRTSKVVSELSKYCRTAFFERTRTGLEPTTLAIEIANLYREISRDLDVNSVKSISFHASRPQRLAIGMLPFGGQRIVSKTIADLMARRDIPYLSTVHGTYEVLCRALRSGEIDCLVGALREEQVDADFSEAYLYPEHFKFITNAQPSEDGDDEDVSRLTNRTWLVGPEGTPARATFNTFFKRLGLQAPDRVFEMSSFPEAEDLLGNSNSIGVMCYSQRDLGSMPPSLKQLQLGWDLASPKIGLTFNRRKTAGPMLSDFAETIKTVAVREMSPVFV